MKAAVVTAFTEPLEIVEREVPAPGPGQVLVRIEASGLCHTDIHAAGGDWPVKPTPAVRPGHEGVGIVEQLGAGVTSRRVGERVAIAWLGSACGACRYCVDGRETLCEQQQNSGYSVDGAFAEYAVAGAAYVVPVPDGVTSVDAAPLTCAGVTTYKAIKVAQVAPAERVGVFGIGGLGHLAVQYARIVGGTVVAVDIEPDKLDLARELGAATRVNAGRTDPVAAIQALGGARRRRRRWPPPPRLRAGLRLAAPRRPPGLRRPAGRRGDDDHPDLRDRAEGHLDHRLDRRHPPGPGRGVRAARRRAHPGHRRDPQARRRQRGDRRGARRRGPRPPRLRVRAVPADLPVVI